MRVFSGLLHFTLLDFIFCSDFISAIASVSGHVYFNRNFLEAIKCV